MVVDPGTLASLASGLGGGGSTKQSTNVSSSLSASVVSSPVISVVTQGQSNPVGGGGSASSNPSADASSSFGGDAFGLPSQYGLDRFPQTLRFPASFNDIDRAPGAASPVNTVRKAGFLDDPMILLAMGGAALLLLSGSKKGKK